MHQRAFLGACAILPLIGFIRSVVSPSGDTPTLIVGVIFAMYAGVLALLFLPTYLQATKWCDNADRAVAFTVGSIFLAHIVAIGGAVITQSNAFLLAYLALATGSSLVLRNTGLCNEGVE